MSRPHPAPFRLASSALAAASQGQPLRWQNAAACCEAEQPVDEPAPGRARLAELNPHLHCSVLGTCMGTAELRKLMARFIAVQGLSDLDVHHEAVRLCVEDGRVAKALHKALDKRHEPVLQRFARTRDAAGLGLLWDEALKQGEIPGAYWAMLTHRQITPELRQRAFGDVHMLSHLVGAANRADIRRLVALEQDNADLRERLERQQASTQQLLAERDAAQAERDAARLKIEAARHDATPASGPGPLAELRQQLAALSSSTGLQTQRREAAETAAELARREAQRLQEELQRLQAHTAELARELGAAEAQLRRTREDGDAGLQGALQGQRILYVGGRPSSTPAIRELVAAHGGECRRHDGGLEDRKGLLAAGLAWATLVVFPVDCIDHDSALALKRDCLRQGRRFVALRSASVSCFIANLPAYQR